MQAQSAETPLRDSDDIQGNILAGFRKDFQDFVFLRFPDAQHGRDWCGALLDQVGIAATRGVAAFNEQFRRRRLAHNGEDPPDLAAVWVNVAFTFAGLDTLVPERKLANELWEIFPAFCEGPAHRAGMLGDRDDSHPSRWIIGRAHEPVHAMVTIAADRKSDLLKKLEELTSTVAQYGLTVVGIEEGRALTGALKGREHFGFSDGISQPAIQGFDVPGDPRLEGAPLLAPGEFLLGYARE